MYFDFNDINCIEGVYAPSNVKIRNSASFIYWQRSFYERFLSAIDMHVPWNGMIKNIFDFWLAGYGYLCVFNTDEYGITFQKCSLSGMGLYYQPTHCIVTNSLLPTNTEMKIGEDCELLQLTPSMTSVFSIINKFAEKAALIDAAIDMNIINSKFAYAIGAKNKAAAEAVKKIFDKIDRGESTVVYDKSIFQNDDRSTDSVFDFINRGDIKSSYIVPEQLQDINNVIRMFDTEIGIPTIPYEKKERMVDAEARSKEQESQSRLITWLDCLNSSAGRINAMFGTEMSFTSRFIGGEADAAKTDA